jgi:DNA-binding NtrC family response regulator
MEPQIIGVDMAREPDQQVTLLHIRIGETTADEARDALFTLTLKHFAGDKAATAKSLGVCTKTLYNWINKPRSQ